MEYGLHTLPSDFKIHDAVVSRLNHQSFGAQPEVVRSKQQAERDLWTAQPDGQMFSGKLAEGIRDATKSVVPLLISTARYNQVVDVASSQPQCEKTSSTTDSSAVVSISDVKNDPTCILPKSVYPGCISDGQVCLTQNLTTGAVTVASRWANQMSATNRDYTKRLQTFISDCDSKGEGAQPMPREPKILVFCTNPTFEPCRYALSHYC